MNKLLQWGMVATAAIAAVPAQAASFTFDFTQAGKVSGSGVTNAMVYGTKTGAETLNVNVTAWNRPVGDVPIQQAEVGQWNGAGLGALVPNETASASHQVDNVNGWEFLVLQFDRSVSLTSGVFNAYQYGNLAIDNDAFVAGLDAGVQWNQRLPLQALKWENTPAKDLSEYFKFSGNFGNDGPNTNPFKALNVSGTQGNVWLIGASINGPDGLNDAFKLAGLTVTAVPEPATWAMMLTGFGMVAGAARYRRRKTTAAIA